MTIPIGALISGLSFLVYGWLCIYSNAMKEEFERFGLERFRVMIGLLEMLGGAGLIVGLWWPLAFQIASAGLTALMFLGIGVRLKCRDGILKTLPALLLFCLNLFLFWHSMAPKSLAVGVACIVAVGPVAFIKKGSR